MAKLPIDVTRAINSQLPKEIGKKLEAMVLKEFEVIKKAMIQEFEMHPVTIEIEEPSTFVTVQFSHNWNGTAVS